VRDFFADPVRSGATLSPDGTHLAYLAPERNRLNVWLEPVGGGEAVCVTHDHNRGIHRYRWSGDPRWLLYAQDDDGDECWHVFRVDLDHPDEPAVDLTPFPKVVVHHELLAGDPRHALITMNRRRPDEVDVHRLDLLTGDIDLVAENPGNVAAWIVGPSGAIFATTLDEEGNSTIHRWDAETGLTALATFSGADNPLGVTPIQVTPNGDGLWVGSNRGSEHTRLVHISAVDGTETVVSVHDTLGIDETAAVAQLPPALICDRATGELLAVRYLGERQAIDVVDERFGDVLSALEQLADGDLGAISGDESGRHWVASFTHDTKPDHTYYYDHATGASRLLFEAYPHLDPDVLAPMKPISFTARDGWSVHGYLTVPNGVEPVGLPMVLLVHGGPWFRDRWGFNPRVQLLANRGYAVLQVNMRGSTGYGKSFTRAAIGEFAGAMHADLVDGVRWAVAEGIADSDRVVIFGGSYGGYSALVGATFTPEVFAAAIDYCGISNLANFMRTLPIQVRKFLQSNWFLYVGDPADPQEAADMLARSPISRLDAICRPLLVIQGSNDARVVQAESDNVVESLRARGADVEYLVKANEGHGFTNPENNIEMFEVIENFLVRTLGAGAGR
jgi:dipeptidyl aminopeptidase/acylaminoacyl peptidase